MIYQYFINLFGANLFNDTELVFSDGSMKVSRMILAGHSKYFFDLLTKDVTQTKFDIKNLKMADFKVYYEYVHCGDDFKIDGDKILAFFQVQIELNLPDIRIKLIEWIKKNDFIIYQGIFYENSSKSELEEYHNLTKQLISINFKSLCEIKAFDSFSRDNFLRLMSKDFIKNMDQGIILDIIARWVEYDFINRKSDWLDLVSQIDYTKVERITLGEYVQKNEKIYSIPDLMKFLIPKICVKKNEKTVVSSILAKNSYSKMILFGGAQPDQSVVEIYTKQSSVKAIRDLSIGKKFHCSEKIGNDVFVLGDRNSKKIEKYNLESNQSEVLSFEMTFNKNIYSSVVHSNRIYVIGGRLNGNSIDTVEYFEPEKMKWIDAPKLLQSIRCHDSVIVDEIIYAVGDISSTKFQRFDPREGKWNFLADISNKTYGTALSVFEHTITCSGGQNARLLCQVYDIRNNKWDKLTNLTIPFLGAKSIENETSIIVAGGENSNQIQSYSKNNKTWSIMNITLPHKNYYSSKIWL
uniref:BTB domain-containing protein n=1 Tax=Rhabditophanes sp. KR3021 TaxID=114890 RepID=A0AC35TXC4_9BILA